MAEVGTKTGSKTQAGRDVYKTPEGEMVSEKSTTFKYKGKWINVPTIHNGYAYDDDILRMMLDSEVIKPTSTHKSKEDAIKSAVERSKSLNFNEGGMADYRKRLVDMTDEERAEVAPSAGNFSDVYGDRTDKPLSVQMAEAGLDFTPVGAAMAVSDELDQEDPSLLKIAGITAAEVVGSAAPMAKPVLKSMLRKGDDVAVNLTEQALTNTLDDLNISADDLEKWRKKNYAKNKFRVPPQEKLADAADALRQGEITSAEFRELSGVFQPILPIKKMPKFPTKKDVAQALHATGGDKKVNKGIIGVNKTIEDGTQISARLDIPAYNDTDTWVVTLHDGVDKSGATVGYGQTAVLNNVNFTTNPLAASSIAAGNSKATIARMNGEWENMDPEAVYKKATELLDSDEWVQVGMNPYRASYFYDKADGMPILSAEQVIQVGPLVLAKKVKKTTPDDEMFQFTDKRTGVTTNFNQGGKVTKNQNREDAIEYAISRSDTRKQEEPPMLEQQMDLFNEGGLKDEGGMVDEESGNDVPNGSTKKEVRDDVPAMLSEGEFVLPADVVRFHGLEKIMQLRDEAKFGIKKMEAMGQMGNSEEATLDDDVPFGPADLIIVGGGPMEDEDKPREMAEGGMVHAAAGTFVPSSGIAGYQPSIYQGQQTTASYTPPPSSVAPPPPTASPAGGYMPKFVTNQTTPFNDGSLPANIGSTSTAQTATNTSTGVNTASTEDKFFDTVGDVYTTKEYINPETGERKTISFYNGNPLVDIPDGFILLSDYENQTDDIESTSVETTQVTPIRDDKGADKLRLSNMTMQQSGSALSALKDAGKDSILDAWHKNQQSKAMMTTLSFINPVVGMAGRAAASHFGNQLEDLMKEKGIDIPDITADKQSFLQKVGTGIKNMFADVSNPFSNVAEEGTSYAPIYSPQNSPYGDGASNNLLTTTNTGSAFTSSQAEAYDNAVSSGNVDVAQHYEILNARYNRMSEYMAAGGAEGGASTSGMSSHTLQQAEKLFDSEGNRIFDTVNEADAANSSDGDGDSGTTTTAASSDKNIVEKFFDGVAEFFGFGGDD